MKWIRNRMAFVERKKDSVDWVEADLNVSLQLIIRKWTK